MSPSFLEQYEFFKPQPALAKLHLKTSLKTGLNEIDTGIDHQDFMIFSQGFELLKEIYPSMNPEQQDQLQQKFNELLGRFKPAVERIFPGDRKFTSSVFPHLRIEERDFNKVLGINPTLNL